MANGLTITAPASGAVGQGIAVTGTVTPTGDGVQVQLDTQNTTPPTGQWRDASAAQGAFSAVLTAIAPGTWYAWALDPQTGLSTVSAAISIVGGDSQALDAVPVPIDDVASRVAVIVRAGIAAAPQSNPATIASNFTVPAASNAWSVGPVTLAADVTATVPPGSSWKVF